ncbi:MAG: hypothetical protein GX978_04725 [Tissierellia bacterium]|nr:hypothetical protein [Tissierellia bacterium]
MKLQLTHKALHYLKKKQIDVITVDLDSFGTCLPVSVATVLEAPPQIKPELYDKYLVDGITIFVFEPMEFRGNVIRIDLQKKLFGQAHLVAGDLRLT